MSDPVDTDALLIPTTDEIREEIGWAETGPWTEIDEHVKARVAARQRAFDRWLAVHDAAATDKLDRLRAELKARDERTGMEIGFRHTVEQKYDRLRAVIENAPHDVDKCDRMTYDGYDESRPCTCWKADAL